MDVTKEAKSLIEEVFHLNDANIEDVGCFRRENDICIDVKLTDKRVECPECGCKKVKIKGYVQKTINHSILAERSCKLIYHARRYVCPVCKKTFYEHNPFVFKKMKISSQVVVASLNDLKNPSETFTSVAERYKLSPTSVASIFDTYVSIPRSLLPTILSIDENYCFHSKEHDSKYVCMFIDQQSGEPIDVLPSRRYDYLDRYFKAIPKKEKDNVHYISTDMYEPYRNIVRKHFPQAVHCIDRYHIAQELLRKVNRVRITEMNEHSYKNVKDRSKQDSDAYYILKNYNWMLGKHYMDAKDKYGRRLFDPNGKKEYNHHFKRYMNFYDIAQKMIAISPKLNTVWELKDAMTDFYNKNTINTAGKEINKMIQRFLGSDIKEMNEFGKTMCRWRQEIVNSFSISKAEHIVDPKTGNVEIKEKRVNNALMENRNGILKLITKAANGYKNWDRFRTRAMFVLLPNDIKFGIDGINGSIQLIEKND